MTRNSLKGMFAAVAVTAMVALTVPVTAGEYVVRPLDMVDYKAVFGQVAPRNLVPARARIGGSVVKLDVSEGSRVTAGQVIAVVVDEKLALKKSAIESSLQATRAQLANAESELSRGRQLFSRGLIAKTRFDQLATQVDVLRNNVASLVAEKAVVEEQVKQGAVEAPATGRVLQVPVTVNSVVLPGESIARIAGGGYFLRLSLPERHAAVIRQGDEVIVGARGIMARQASRPARRRSGRLVKVYPELVDGQVRADVEVDGLGDFFVGERTRVWIPVARRTVLAVPPEALSVRHGVDYVRVIGKDGAVAVAVVRGRRFSAGDGERVEILSGLKADDRVLVP